MIQKKISILGTFGVGKTSLTERFVKSIFSERYHTTVGVRIHKKLMQVEGKDLTCIIWDIAGEDEFVEIRPSHLRGSSGYFIVADGTRPETLTKAMNIQHLAQSVLGEVPFTLIVNKVDREDHWLIEEPELENIRASGWVVKKTSAKSDTGVSEAFLDLANRIMHR